MVYLLYQLQEAIFMMGKQSGQIQMVIHDIDSMIPENHLLRRIKNCVNFDFIYEKAAPYYSPVGRKSIDPVVLIKMLLDVYKRQGRVCEGGAFLYPVRQQPGL